MNPIVRFSLGHSAGFRPSESQEERFIRIASQNHSYPKEGSKTVSVEFLGATSSTVALVTSASEEDDAEEENELASDDNKESD